MANFDEYGDGIDYIDQMANAKGYSQEYVDFLKGCAEWANGKQMHQICHGLKNDVDVSVYADPRFDDWQMYQIREGLESGVDVSIYADPRFNYKQMALIRHDLENGVDVSYYADPKLDAWQMEQIRERFGAEKN